MRKVFDYLFILLVLCILIVPVIRMNREHYAVSEIDNRVLAFEPEFKDKTFHDDLEAYLKDRIGYRKDMIRVYNQINDIFAHEMTHPSYTYGKDDYVFFKMHKNVEYGDYHIVFAQFLKSMQDYCEARGAKFYFAFEPEKLSIYREYLPSGVNYNDEWVEAFFEQLDELSVHYIDNSSYLQEQAKNEQVFSVQYDAGHWNELGCFYGTKNIMDRISQDFPSIPGMSFDDYEISTKVAQYLPVSEFTVNETIPSFKLKESYRNVTTAYAPYLEIDPSHKYFHYVRYENKTDLPRMLVFQGSYYNSRPQFIASQCSEYIAVHNYVNVCNLDYYFQAFQPDVVLFEAAEYTFQEQYFPVKQMKEPKWSPALIDKRENSNYDEDLATLLSSCEVGNSISLHALDCNQLTRFYIYRADVYSAEYVYVISDNQIYDLSLDTNGDFSALLPSDIERKNMSIVLVHYDGQMSVHGCNLKPASSCIFEPVLSSNVSLEKDVSSYVSRKNFVPQSGYVFSTDVDENRFSSFQIQLINKVNGKYLETILSTTKTGKTTLKYQMKYSSGWYTIRLKANSSLQDEYMDYLMYMEEGEWYYLSLNVEEVIQSNIVLGTSISISGTGLQSASERDLQYEWTLSEHTSMTPDQMITMTTDVEGNRFSSAILQAMNTDSCQYTPVICKASDLGEYHGFYYHEDIGGQYQLRLRANSNIKDEYLECDIDFKQHALYEYSFTVDSMSEDCVQIRDFTFVEVAEVDN